MYSEYHWKSEGFHGTSFRCHFCRVDFQDEPYIKCSDCNLYMDLVCMAKKRKIISHPFHPNHHIKLGRYSQFWCHSCHKSFTEAFAYRCIDGNSRLSFRLRCDFHMCIKCAWMPPPRRSGRREEIEHFSHQHPMELVEKKVDILCFACQSYCSGPTYACTACMYFLHKSCAELPLKVTHRDFHTLALHAKHGEYDCQICHGKGCGFVYLSEQCEISVCINCAEPVIEYHGHDHLLYLINEETSDADRTDHCNGYGTYCKQSAVDSIEFREAKSYVFQCRERNFYVHLLCGPLPDKLKHKCHIHPLILHDSLIEDDSGEYYCDACEKERDVRICVYYCAECKYIAHVHCVISEVIKVLQGPRNNDVELITVGEHNLTVKEEQSYERVNRAGQTTLQDLINFMNETEKNMFYENFSQEDDEYKINISESSHDHLGDDQDFSPYNDQHFEKLVSRLDNVRKHESSKFKPTEELGLKDIVYVNGYMVPLKLAHIVKHLLDKYGDISGGPNSSFTGEMRSFMFCLLGSVVNSMQKTRVMNITEDLLREWYVYLTYIQRCGFQVDFIFKHLEQVRYAYFGLQASKRESDMPEKLDKMIEEQIHKLKMYEHYHMQQNESSKTSTKSELMKLCARKALELKWKTGYEGLL